MSIAKIFVTALVILFCFVGKAHSFGRLHEYIIEVVDQNSEPKPNIIIKTQQVKGYDQSALSCITSLNGRCSLKFTAFAPVDTLVVVTLEAADRSVASKPQTLPKVQNSFFSNNDSIVAKLVFDAEQMKTRRQAKIDQQKRWELNKGPNLSEVTSAEPIHISEFLKQSRSLKISKGVREKFETDAEFNERMKKNRSNFIYVDLPMNNELKCKSEYQHTESLYKVACNINGDGGPLSTFNYTGESFILSNAYDKREISKNMNNVVFVPIDFEWLAEFKIDRNMARSLDKDMAIGFLSDDQIEVKSSCDLCDSRMRQDANAKTIENLNEISESLSVITNRRRSYTPPPKSWKDDAFREGSIIEDWKHVIGTDSIKSIVIFRKSDKSIIFQSIK